MDFGAASVKVVALAREGERLSLLAAGREALPPGAIESGAVREPESAGSALGRLLGRLPVRCRQASLAIGGSSLFWKRIPAPAGVPASDPGFREAVAREAARHLPFHLESLEFDYGLPPPPSGGSAAAEVVFGAAPRDTLRAHCDAVRRAGREAVQIELEPCALFEAVRLAAAGDPGPAPPGPLAIVEIGASRAAAHVFASSPVGSAAPTTDDPSGALLSSVQVPGAGLLGYEEGAASPANEVFANRAAATLREALGEAGSAPPVRLVLSGGGALVPEVVAPLAALALERPTLLDALGAFRQDAEGPLFSVAAGLAAARLALLGNPA